MSVAYRQIMPSDRPDQPKVPSNVAATPLKVQVSDDDNGYIDEDSTYFGNPFESKDQMKAKLKSGNLGDIAKNLLANSVQLAAVKN